VDDDEIRTGNAMILDPYGRILEETWKAGTIWSFADLDPVLLEERRGGGGSRPAAPSYTDR